MAIARSNIVRCALKSGTDYHHLLKRLSEFSGDPQEVFEEVKLFLTLSI